MNRSSKNGFKFCVIIIPWWGQWSRQQEVAHAQAWDVDAPSPYVRLYHKEGRSPSGTDSRVGSGLNEYN